MTKATHKQAKKSDYFSAGKPVHRLSYCAFLDVLGFLERIRDSYKDGGADTLLGSFIEGDDREYLDADSLGLHKQQIESALKSYAAVPAVSSKFSWLAAYHNYFCDMVSTFPVRSRSGRATSFDRA